MNDDSFQTFCDALGTPNNTQVQLAKGIKVNAAVLNYAAYVNRVRHLLYDVTDVSVL